MKRALPLHLATSLLAACNGGPEVQVTKVSRGTIQEFFSEPAKTRLERRFIVSMPSDATVARIDPKPGDRVTKGQRLIDVDMAPHEARLAQAKATVAELEAQLAVARDISVEEATLAGAESRVSSLRAQRSSAEARKRSEELRATRTNKEFKRLEESRREAAVTESQLDDAKLNDDMMRIAVEQSTIDLARIDADIAAQEQTVALNRATVERRKLDVAAIESGLANARAALASQQHEYDLLNITSPIDGVILERYEIGGGPLRGGTRLFQIGNLAELEVETECLSQDAVQIGPGSEVEYTIATDVPPLRGKVTRVEPFGFTKLSSLGVEQQRVIVISSLENRPDNIGMGYRLQAKFFEATKEKALVIPRYSLLQTPEGAFYVFGVEGGKLQKKTVTIGLRSDFTVEVATGLNEGDLIVSTPESKMVEGTAVTAKE